MKDGGDVLGSDLPSLGSINNCMQMGLRLAAMAMQVLYAMGKSFHLEALNH
jgi:hypothetical protein